MRLHGGKKRRRDTVSSDSSGRRKLEEQSQTGFVDGSLLGPGVGPRVILLMSCNSVMAPGISQNRRR